MQLPKIIRRLPLEIGQRVDAGFEIEHNKFLSIEFDAYSMSQRLASDFGPSQNQRVEKRDSIYRAPNPQALAHLPTSNPAARSLFYSVYFLLLYSLSRATLFT
jgi:hypothetical protein